jgi:hypothetical protein
MTRPSTWRECAEAGMTATEAAQHLGKTANAGSQYAKRHGFAFRKDYSAHAERMRKRHADPEFAKANAERMRKRHADPEFAKANAERMRKLNADPEFAKANAERMRKRHADPEFNPLAALTLEQRADYDVLKKAGYTREEAFEALGIEAGAQS